MEAYQRGPQGGDLLKYLIFLSLFIWATAAQAQYYQMALRELRLVQAASLIPESVEESPWPTTVITAEHLKRFGWRNIREVLEYLPSFYLIQDVNERVVAHRGIFRTNTSHLLFLEGGVRLDAPDLNNFLGDYDYPLTDVSRIEVIRGPGSSLYGTSAFTGMINVEREPPQKGTLLLEGAKDQELADLSLKKGPLYLLGHYWNREGEKITLGKEWDYAEVAVGGEQRIHPAPNNYALLGRWGSKNQYLAWWHFRHEYKTPRGQRGQILLPEDRSPFGSHERAYLDILALKKDFTWHKFKITLLPTVTYLNLDSPQVLFTKRESEGPKYLDAEMESLRYTLNLHASRPLSNGDAFVLGGVVEGQDIKHYWLQSLSLTQEYKEKLPSTIEYNYGLFAQYKKHLWKRLLFNLGLRYDYYESFGGHFSPRLALIWALNPKWRVGLSYGEAFKAPPYFYRVSNPVLGYGSSSNLKEEILRNLSLSLSYYRDEKTFWRAVGYYQEVTDFIAYNSIKREYENAGKMGLLGLEIEGQYFTEPLIFFFNYSFYNLTENNGSFCVQGEYLCSLPRWMIKGGLSLRLPAPFPLYLSPMWRIYGKALHHSLRKMPSYALFDLNLLAEVKPHWRAGLRVENLLDKRYFRSGSVPPYPWPGRTTYFYLEVAF